MTTAVREPFVLALYLYPATQFEIERMLIRYIVFRIDIAVTMLLTELSDGSETARSGPAAGADASQSSTVLAPQLIRSKGGDGCCVPACTNGRGLSSRHRGPARSSA